MLLYSRKRYQMIQSVLSERASKQARTLYARGEVRTRKRNIQKSRRGKDRLSSQESKAAARHTERTTPHSVCSAPKAGGHEPTRFGVLAVIGCANTEPGLAGTPPTGTDLLGREIRSRVQTPGARAPVAVRASIDRMGGKECLTYPIVISVGAT